MSRAGNLEHAQYRWPNNKSRIGSTTILARGL